MDFALPPGVEAFRDELRAFLAANLNTEVLEASRLSNPTIGYRDLSPRDGGRSQVSRSISMSFMDILLLPARSRLARTVSRRYVRREPSVRHQQRDIRV